MLICFYVASLRVIDDRGPSHSNRSRRRDDDQRDDHKNERERERERRGEEEDVCVCRSCHAQNSIPMRTTRPTTAIDTTVIDAASSPPLFGMKFAVTLRRP